MRLIPSLPPDHLISPVGTYTGWRGPAGRLIDLEWDDQHTRAEEASPLDHPDLMPVTDLYVDGPHLNYAMGWCVDA